jgi:hypothetical protein
MSVCWQTYMYNFERSVKVYVYSWSSRVQTYSMPEAIRYRNRRPLLTNDSTRTMRRHPLHDPAVALHHTNVNARWAISPTSVLHSKE